MARKMVKGDGVLPKSTMEFCEQEVEYRKHRKNPFDAKYMHMATSSFSALCKDNHSRPATRAEVDAASFNVHVRLELIKSMKDNLVKSTTEAIRHLKACQQKCDKRDERGYVEEAKALDNAVSIENTKIELESFYDMDMYNLYQERLSQYEPMLLREVQRQTNRTSESCFLEASHQQIDFMGDLIKIANELECQAGCNFHNKENTSFDCDKEVSLPFENVVQRLWPEGFFACSSEDHQYLCSELTAYKQFIRPIQKELALVDTESESEDESNVDDSTLKDGSKANTQEFEAYEPDSNCPMRLPLTSNKNASTAKPVEDIYNASFPVHFDEENHESQNNRIQSLACAGTDETPKIKNKPIFVSIDGSVKSSSGSLKAGDDGAWICDEASESIEQFSDNGSAFNAVDHLDHTYFSDPDQLDFNISKTKKKSSLVVSLKMHEDADNFLKARMKQVAKMKSKPRVESNVEHLLIPCLKDARKENADCKKEENIDLHASDNKAMFRSSLCRESIDLVEYRRLFLKEPLKIPRSLNFVSLSRCIEDNEMNCDYTFETAHALLNQSMQTDIFSSYAPSVQVSKSIPKPVATTVIPTSLSCSTGAIDVQANVDMGKEFDKNSQFSKYRDALSSEAKMENNESQRYSEDYESCENMISELSLKQEKETGKSLKQEVAERIVKLKVCKLQDFISDILQRELQIQEQGAYVHKVAPLLRETLVNEATRLHQLGEKIHFTFGYLLNFCLKGNLTSLENGKDNDQAIPLRHCLLDMINFAHQHNIGSHKLIEGVFLNGYDIKLDFVPASQLQDMTISFIQVEEPKKL